MKINVLNSPRLLELKKKRRRVFLNKILLSIIALLIIYGGLAYLSRLSVFNIEGVEIIGNKVVDAEAIKAAVLKEITGNYLWFFPKTNILLYPKNSIKKDLLNEFRRIKDISFSLKNSKILSISLSERDGEYIWCGLPAQTGENLSGTETGREDSLCSFMDSGGYVFDVAPYFSGNVYFKFFGTLTNYYFSPDIFEKLIKFKDTLINLGMKPVSLYVKDDGDIEIYLSSNVLPPDSPKIILKKDFDLEKTSENLQTALDTEPLKSNLKNKYSSLLYIDLRFGNKVYYKFK